MNKAIVSFWGICCACAFFAACAAAPETNEQNTAQADAAALAQAALDRMDGKAPSGGNGQSAADRGKNANRQEQPPVGQSAAARQNAVTVNTAKNRPAWVDSVEVSYNRNRYVAAVGYAQNRAMAERNAFANLTGIFGQSIQADQTIVNTYQEAVRDGVTAGWTDNTAMQNTITTRASMDTLVGAEIKEVWYDSKDTYYAAAVMEKAAAASLYTEMIAANQNVIRNLTAMNQAEKNSLEGYSRYQFAAAVADINVSYGNLLRVIEAPVPEGVVKGDDYRLEAASIARTIPVAVNVKNDKAGRIQGAFAKALADLGFRSGGTNSRYKLDADLTITEVQLANPNKFARYVIDANLVDSAAGGATLVPYNINGREGHTTVSEAENRALAAAERKINAEYAALLQDYLSRLLPKR